MTRVTSRRGSVQVNIAISPPVFDWNGVPSRFFAMIHDVLSVEITVKPGHFSEVPAVNLGEVVARYDIFGGPSHIALRPDGLVMEFPVLLPEDSGLVQGIIEHIFVAFQQTFPDHQYMTVQANLSHHAEILDGSAVNDYLAGYAIPSVGGAFGRKVLHLPAARFGVVDAAAAWDARCIVEKSDFLQNGLFVGLDMTFRKVNENNNSFQYLFNLYNTIAGCCSTALELEWGN